MAGLIARPYNQRGPVLLSTQPDHGSASTTIRPELSPFITNLWPVLGSFISFKELIEIREDHFDIFTLVGELLF